ncbi:Peptidase S1/S6, partial [Aphelenchoides avenae]
RTLMSVLEGDSGGPLMTYSRSENKWYQIGVDGYGCEDPYPCKHGEVFSRVTSFCKWIEESTD